MIGIVRRVRRRSPLKFAQDEFLRGVKTAIEKNRAEHGFKGIGQRRGAFAAAVGFLAAAQMQMFAPRFSAAPCSARVLAVHQFGAGLGQRAFVEAGKFVVEFAGQDELEDGVAEKLEALVVSASPRPARGRPTDA